MVDTATIPNSFLTFLYFIFLSSEKSQKSVKPIISRVFVKINTSDIVEKILVAKVLRLDIRRLV